MVKPYSALAVQVGWPKITKREDIKKIAIPHIDHIIERSIAGASWEARTRLVALPEACLSGWTAEFTMDHLTFCKEMAIESIPGEETELLGELAKKYNAYLIACAKALDRDIAENRYFNIAFLIDPQGKTILKHYKLQTITGSCSTTAQDVWDKYVGKFGDDLDAFFQVADTDIGRIGLMICMEGCFPEIARGYGLRGAEVVYRCSYGEPYSSAGGPNWWEIQNRSMALNNNFYMVCPNDGPRYPDEAPYNMCGGHSMVVDYRGQVLSVASHGVEGYASAKINIEELRYHRATTVTTNWVPLLRTEYYRKFYEKPIHPRNVWLNKPYSTQEEYADIIRKTIQKFQEDGVFIPPSDGVSD